MYRIIFIYNYNTTFFFLKRGKLASFIKNKKYRQTSAVPSANYLLENFRPERSEKINDT